MSEIRIDATLEELVAKIEALEADNESLREELHDAEDECCNFTQMIEELEICLGEMDEELKNISLEFEELQSDYDDLYHAAAEHGLVEPYTDDDTTGKVTH